MGRIDERGTGRVAVADERGGWVGRRLVEGVGVTIDDLLVEG